ncbi:GNAT family N-acetyltransferase [Levilactobacillus fujinensis]|uniref:GNAT family N-acetyltransferase n=1 Tax=Levilactobacillus fujinensis TaxID=2486024 RepID=A0ABW1THR4_9LACO|nr:GNAT family N-acetyltransferase [Levilactobacillus fujinensis]
MLTIRRFVPTDAAAVAQVVAKTLRTTNRQDYTEAYIEHTIQRLTPRFFLEKAQQTHFYVVCDAACIVGTGAIGSYWGSSTEFSLFDIFVLPIYQGQGIGRLIISTLEHDSYFQRAERVEIPASITALGFYQKMGYQFKAGHEQVDDEQLYRLEKLF